MSRILLSFFTIIVVLASCQKELSESNDGGHPTDSTITRILVKKVLISGARWSDTTTTEYRYDLGNIESEKVTMKVLLNSGVYETMRFFTCYYRDQAGRIVKISRMGPYSDQRNIADTLFDIVTYKSPSSYQVSSIKTSSGVRDYYYNSAGKVSRTDDYMPWPNPTDSLETMVYHLYTYDSHGNMTKREEFTDFDHNGVFEVNITYSFEYDDKRNPIYSGDDALIEWRWALMSFNNVLRQKNDIADPAGIDDVMITKYEYLDDDQPDEARYNIGGIPVLVKYYYQF